MLNVTLGSAHRHAALTIFPLLSRDAPELPYTLMSDALRHGVLRITEVGSGTVPALLAINGGDDVILVLDGEQLVGAKQNRTTNRSLLLAAHSETKIPVSCMEHGRWHFNSDHFAPTANSSSTTVRRKARQVEAVRAQYGEAVPAEALSQAQGEVWDAIAEQASALGVRSQTGALNEVYASREVDLEAWSRRYALEPRQVGILAFLGARPLGMDLLGCATLYAQLHDRLLRGYIMDALAVTSRARTPSAATAQRFLDRVRDARRVESPTVGIGRYAVLSGEVIGGELSDAETIVHLSAFPAQKRRGGSAPIAPPSQRRRRM